MESILLTDKYQSLDIRSATFTKVFSEMRMGAMDALCVKLTFSEYNTAEFFLPFCQFMKPSDMQDNVVEFDKTFFSENIEVKFNKKPENGAVRLFYNKY